MSLKQHMSGAVNEEKQKNGQCMPTNICHQVARQGTKE